MERSKTFFCISRLKFRCSYDIGQTICAIMSIENSTRTLFFFFSFFSPRKWARKKMSFFLLNFPSFLPFLFFVVVIVVVYLRGVVLPIMWYVNVDSKLLVGAIYDLVRRILPCYCVFDTALFVASVTRIELGWTTTKNVSARVLLFYFFFVFVSTQLFLLHLFILLLWFLYLVFMFLWRWVAHFVSAFVCFRLFIRRP